MHYYVMSRSVRASTVAVAKPYVLHREYVCGLSYPACIAHAPYRHLWPVRLYHVFPRYLMNGTIVARQTY